ncbi:MAG: DUF6178 family protein [Pseudomonadota bacterium]
MKNKFEIVIEDNLEIMDADHLLSLNNPLEVIQKLPYNTLYFTIKECGPKKGLDLVRYSSTKQIIGYMDLDIWKADQIEGKNLTMWLSSLCQCGVEKLKGVVAKMDFELLSYYLYDLTLIRENDDDNYANTNWDVSFLSPDFAFIISCLENAKRTTIQKVIEAVYFNDVNTGFNTLSLLSQAVKAELLEDAYCLRNARLADIGMLEYEESMQIYRVKNKREKDKILKTMDIQKLPGQNSNLPVSFAKLFENSSPLKELLSKIIDQEKLESFIFHIVWLLNKAIAANIANPSNKKDIDLIMNETYSNLCNGIQILEEDGFTSEQISQINPQIIFTEGFTILVHLKSKLRKILASNLYKKLSEYDISPLNEKESEIAKTLNKPIPKLYNYSQNNNYKTIGTKLEHLLDKINFLENTIECNLSGLEKVAFTKCNIDPNNLSFETIILTLWIKHRLHGNNTLEPINSDDLSVFINKYFKSPETEIQNIQTKFPDISLLIIKIFTEQLTQLQQIAHNKILDTRFIDIIWMYL